MTSAAIYGCSGHKLTAEERAFFAEVRRVDVETFGFEHQFNALRRGAVVFDQQYAHQFLLER